MNRKIEDPLKYLEKKIDPEGPQDQEYSEQVINRMKTPLQKIDYPEEGETRIEKGDLEIEMAFQPAKRFVEKDGKTDFELNRALYSPGNWKMIEKFIMRNKKAGAEIDFLNVLPKGYRIIWDSDIDSDNNKEPIQTADFEKKICLSRGDLAQPRIIVGLLHEIGHCVDCEDMAEFFERNQYGRDKILFDIYRYDPDQKMPAASLERMLRAERNAWSFALRKIRPFFDEENFNKKDTVTYVRERGLASYGKGIRKKMEDGLLEYDWTRSYF